MSSCKTLDTEYGISAPTGMPYLLEIEPRAYFMQGGRDL